MSISEWVIIAVLFLIICFWPTSCQDEQDTLPVHRPQQHLPVYQPPHRPAPPSQSYRPTPYTPLLHQQHQPVRQPPPSPRPPPPSQRHRSSPYIPPIRQPEQHQPDDDQADRSDEYYSDLRACANKEGNEMARCFSESHEAFDRGDHAAAKDLSNQGKDHKQKMEQLNKEASNWIYREKNRGRLPGQIDLHGLYVKEAIAYTDTALASAWLRRDSEIRLIVGKGSHSEGGAKLGPAIIEELIRKYQLVAEIDPSNSGVLIVKLN
ncbi:hypothetical protein IW262DRAFT_1317918 [Armillaria fumosa]|nr:hypothetical protein IW262DRAFT_1317918 [Armillaria fumosa]